MANREELGLIRGARAGQAQAQLALARRYLFGSAGLPRNLPSALHWLDRASQQGCADAWRLIGQHIPLELARQSARPVAQWYALACDAGVAPAALVLAQLVLEPPGVADADLRARALRALAAAADDGVAEAQRLLARHTPTGAAAYSAAATAAVVGRGTGAALRPVDAGWSQRRQDGAVSSPATELDAAWQARQWEPFLRRALPLARALSAAAGQSGARVSTADALLLSRCAQALSAGHGVGQAGSGSGSEEIRRFWEMAANEHERHAQLAVGLWFARMRVDGGRTAAGPGSANFKKAIRWLTLAGEQGLAEAWYALARIYSKPEFSQRNVGDAQVYLERAAEMGYRDAQLECGNGAWRARREHEGNDVRAAYWLQKAAAQGCAQAAAALRKIAPRIAAELPAALVRHALAASHTLLAARLELGSVFGLTRAEALLLDIKAADQGHCLVIDIRASYGRSKRRLVMVDTAHERQILDRIARLFEHIDSGPGGPEGNYRQRLYRLRAALPAPAAGDDDYDLAA